MTHQWDSRFEELLRRAAPLLAEGPIDPDQDLDVAGLDSMASVELMLQLESTYNVLVPDEALTKETFETPAALWRVVESLLGADSPDRR